MLRHHDMLRYSRKGAQGMYRLCGDVPVLSGDDQLEEERFVPVFPAGEGKGEIPYLRQPPQHLLRVVQAQQMSSCPPPGKASPDLNAAENGAAGAAFREEPPFIAGAVPEKWKGAARQGGERHFPPLSLGEHVSILVPDLR